MVLVGHLVFLLTNKKRKRNNSRSQRSEGIILSLVNECYCVINIFNNVIMNKNSDISCTKKNQPTYIRSY